MIVIFGMSTEIDQSGDRPLILIAAGLLSASLLWVPGIGDLSTTWQQLEIQLVIAAPPWALGVVTLALDVDDDTTTGVTALVIAAVTTLVALGVRSRIKPAHFASLLIGASITLSIALAALMSTSATFAGLAIQGAGLVLLSRLLGGNVRVLANAAIVLGIAGMSTAVEMVDAWSGDVSIADDIGHLVVIAAIGVAAWQTRHLMTQQAGAIVVLALV
jgi:hypothetical protein